MQTEDREKSSHIKWRNCERGIKRQRQTYEWGKKRELEVETHTETKERKLNNINETWSEKEHHVKANQEKKKKQREKTSCIMNARAYYTLSIAIHMACSYMSTRMYAFRHV